jgi:hypothetical protein
MNRSISYLLALVLVLLGIITILFLQDPAMRLFSSERAALYIAFLGAFLLLAGVVLAGFTVIASIRSAS